MECTGFHYLLILSVFSLIFQLCMHICVTLTLNFDFNMHFSASGDVSRVAVRSLMASNVACMMTACIAGKI